VPKRGIGPPEAASAAKVRKARTDAQRRPDGDKETIHFTQPAGCILGRLFVVRILHMRCQIDCGGWRHVMSTNKHLHDVRYVGQGIKPYRRFRITGGAPISAR
jgi:hypothetical protein